MTREIKFRGFNAKNNKWIYGYYFVNRKQHFIVEDGIANPLNTWEDYIVEEETIGQFTGLLDKNGVEIYEGDIVKCEDFVYKIGYDHKRIASFYLFRRGDMYRHYFGEAMENDDCMVIGNIYEHSDILKEEEQP